MSVRPGQADAVQTDRPGADRRSRRRLPTVREILALDAVAHGVPEVLVGDDALDARVRWVHVSDSAGVARLLNGGELLLSTGSGWPTEPRELAAFIAELVDAGHLRTRARARRALPLRARGGRRGRAASAASRSSRCTARSSSWRSPRPCTAASSPSRPTRPARPRRGARAIHRARPARLARRLHRAPARADARRRRSCSRTSPTRWSPPRCRPPLEEELFTTWEAALAPRAPARRAAPRARRARRRRRVAHRARSRRAASGGGTSSRCPVRRTPRAARACSSRARSRWRSAGSPTATPTSGCASAGSACSTGCSPGGSPGSAVRRRGSRRPGCPSTARTSTASSSSGAPVAAGAAGCRGARRSAVARSTGCGARTAALRAGVPHRAAVAARRR